LAATEICAKIRKFQTSTIADEKGKSRTQKLTTERGSAHPQGRKAPPWRADSLSFKSSHLGGVPLAARPPELRDEILTVKRGGKLNRRLSDDQRVGKCSSPARGGSDPRAGQDQLAAASLRRDAIVTVVLGWWLVLCVDDVFLCILGSETILPKK